MSDLRERHRVTDTDEAALSGCLSGHALRMHYQPVVDLVSGAVVGAEALARGPVGSALEMPAQLFAAAHAAGRGAELDAACRREAVETVLRHGVDPRQLLLVNVEPAGLDETALAGLEVLADRARARGLRVLIELTERELAARPAQLLAAVDRLRSFGWGIAVDDVGADPASLAMLPLLQPEVIKLDLRLVQQRPDTEVAAIVQAVNAEVERIGGVLLAEGIETERQRDTALSMGATLGQGWLLGRPARLADRPGGDRAVHRLELPNVARDDDSSPFAVVAGERNLRIAAKRLLVQMSIVLERHAEAAGESAVVVSTFQEAVNFTPATTRRYSRLAEVSTLVAALAAGLPAHPAPGVLGGDLALDDPVTGEWDIAVVGPHFAAVLAARDLGDTGPQAQRRFEYVLSHDRALALRAARTLLRRLPGAASGRAASA